MEYGGAGFLTLPVLIDHSVMPAMEGDMRIFAEGFLVERIGHCRLPILVSIGRHVETVWVVDSSECAAQAARLVPPLQRSFTSSLGMEEQPLLAGLVILFKLKTEYPSPSRNDAEGAAEVLSYNPLQPIVPFSSLIAGSSLESKYIALFVKSASRSSSTIIAALGDWRAAMRMHDVPEYKGAAEVRLPERFLQSYIAFIDWSDRRQDGSPPLSVNALVSAATFCTQHPRLQVAGLRAASTR